MLRRFYPGLEPERLTYFQWTEYLDCIETIASAEAGKPNQTRQVKRNASRR